MHLKRVTFWNICLRGRRGVGHDDMPNPRGVWALYQNYKITAHRIYMDSFLMFFVSDPAGKLMNRVYHHGDGI